MPITARNIAVQAGATGYSLSTIDHTALHHEADASYGFDLLKRIAVERDQVGLIPGREGPDHPPHPERLGIG